MNRQPGLTVVAIDTAFHDLTRLALLDTLKAVEPKEVIVFADRDIGVPGARTIPVEIKSNAEAERFMWEGVHPHLTTPHVLMVQWDSGVVNPLMWDDQFLAFDYIGAPWPWHTDGLNVGNGGFTIRSRKLLEAVAADPDRYPFKQPEDDALCRAYRRDLEARHGLSWAPRHVAQRFAFEHGDWNAWGFHGLWNFVRFFPDGELSHRLALLPKTINKDRVDFQRMMAFAQTHNRQGAVLDGLKSRPPGT